VVGPTPAPPIVWQAYVHAVNAHTARLERLEHARKAHGQAWRLNPVVQALQALRGGPCPVAVTLGAALGDLTRFAHPTALMQDRGLTPSADTRGARRRQGSSTTAGTTPARRVLVEGAWASRDPAHVSRHLQRRRENPSHVIQASSWKAAVRLGQRDRRLLARGTHAHPVVVAMARAFVGFLWAMAQQVPVTPYALKTARGQPCNPAGCPRAGAEAQPRCGVTRDGVTSPRGHTRAEREAGTRRTHVRWSPTPGDQQDQPSCRTGSASADGQREERDTADEDIKNCEHPLTSEVIATSGFSRRWKP
jgi:hypothetical protein